MISFIMWEELAQSSERRFVCRACEQGADCSFGLRHQVNNQVLFEKASYDKLLAEVPKYKLITPSVLSDRLRVSLSYRSSSWGVFFETSHLF
jgi:hypothetical protein